jgi:hypothetical protein
MSEWKSIQVNIQNIETETDQAVLFKCPHKSKYDGYVFWHPHKLVREGKNSYAVRVSYTDEFEFSLKKYGHKKASRHDIIAYARINAGEFEEMFGPSNENISGPKQKDQFETHKPQKIDGEGDVEIESSLRR